VGEVHDTQESKNHREPEAQHGVKRPVDQPEQQLPEKSLKGDTKNVHRVVSGETSARSSA
jgi:hypothetical protein